MGSVWWCIGGHVPCEYAKHIFRFVLTLGPPQLLAQNGNNEGLFVGAIADSPPISLQADCVGPYHEMVSSEVANEL